MISLRNIDLARALDFILEGSVVTAAHCNEMCKTTFEVWLKKSNTNVYVYQVNKSNLFAQGLECAQRRS